jgi:hypothetical protein
MEVILVLVGEKKERFYRRISNSLLETWKVAEMKILRENEQKWLVEGSAFIEDFIYDRDDSRVFTRRYGKFITKEAVLEFYNKRNDLLSTEQFMILNQAARHLGGLAELNILNNDDTINEVLASCQQGFCAKRPGGKCTVGADDTSCFNPEIFDPRTQTERKIHHISVDQIKYFQKK